MKEEWIFGKNPITEALRSNRSIHKIWIADGTKKSHVQEIVQRAKEKNITLLYSPRKKLDELAQTTRHQGVVAVVSAYEYKELDDLFALATERREDPFFVLLDEISDPHNLGSILRTAEASGVHGVIIPKRRSAGLTQVVAKASAGAIEYVPVVRVTNMARTIDALKKQGLWIVGTDMETRDDFRTLDSDMPIGLVIGNEGKGMSRLVKEKCDLLVKIPMNGRVSSLNASVAAGLLMYEIYRKRSPLGRA
ncbi:23S rRNA (guanosine(2251)-2'-O)-methyltransferase RlmB [Aliibacillus thermotolerans]|uniref:23S rRNA (Guanosine(2251)-2'-O)-methyltransferase RlmB n=1 Tax=Aliibacillus thermotolerans TaxID=1834418 RepID=A0ABW0U8X5_9BACI|nr:23S rRNA (guanosine(2251)-2'-O)-methyltransferase RlmB [Aliibacillus thermotolerans]MDA3128897.1 23S rRNA (guanosine(2251)-2'-O)-methyltransferase RlmB [Aliibacillus thermotolerans]